VSQVQFKAPGLRVALRMRAACVLRQVVDGTGHHRCQSLGCMQQRLEYIGEHMMNAHRGPARGDGDTRDALSHVRAIAFQRGRAQRRPDEPFGDGGIAGRKGTQVGVRLPLLEQQLDLPAQPIGIGDLLGAELRTVEIGDQIARFALTRVAMGDQTAGIRCTVVASEPHVEVNDRVPANTPGELFERFATPALDLLTVATEGAPHQRIKVRLAAHDEAAAGAVHGREVVLVKISAVTQQQLTSTLARRREKLRLGGGVGGEHYLVDRLGEQVHVDVQFHSGRETPRPAWTAPQRRSRLGDGSA